MRIAQIAPLAESCPPQLYGGTERIVSYLTEELVRQGHEVTLFASGDSQTRARLVAGSGQALRLNPQIEYPLPFEVMMLDQVMRQADEFDVLNFHSDVLHLPMARRLGWRCVTTLHGTLHRPDCQDFYPRFAEAALVSISMAQRRPLTRSVNWAANIYHGLPKDLLPYTARPEGDYLAFLGRISPQKRPDRAIAIALACGLPLRIAAKVDAQDQAYWEQQILPLVQANPSVQFIGEIDERHKADFLGHARALLFTIDWDEPFGLVMIEAMACGTPVIAFARGSVPEVIDHGQSGFIVHSVAEAVAAVQQLEHLQRHQVRAIFEQRFTVERMTADYLALYRRMIEHAEREQKPVFAIPGGASLPQVRPRTLKHDDTFGVFDPNGDVLATPDSPQGIFHCDTRHLSHWCLTLQGLRPLLLSSTLRDDNAMLTCDLSNPDLYDRQGRRWLLHNLIHLRRSRFLWRGACFERIRVRNFDQRSRRLRLQLGFAADFRDLFEVRGQQRSQRGETHAAQCQAQQVKLSYTGLDDGLRTTTLRFEPPPQQLDGRQAQFELHLAAGESRSLFVEINCGTPRLPWSVRHAFFSSVRDARRELRTFASRATAIHTSHEVFNEAVRRSISDLYMLTSKTLHGLYPYAGIPWYSAVFGRDALITAWEMLWLDPGIARGVLGHLAAHQACELDPRTDAEPGKILHEMRNGEMAALGEIPFACYYGSVDATPLFVMLAGAYLERTDDVDTLRALWPAIERALGWIDQYGDRDGDGFVEYARRSNKGLINQGWKDSHDSVFHADGQLARGPIALVEVQAYVYGAWNAARSIALRLGNRQRAALLKDKAVGLRRQFDAQFFDEELGTYVLALDGDKRPCRVRTSNAGHALFGGIAYDERAPQVVATLMERTSFSGWGIRTLASSQARYNPMSYHNGSVWPHDNALIAAGFARYGFRHESAQLCEGLFAASTYLDLRRLPELFCGFARQRTQGPTFYPVACAPQAWAAAAPLSMLQSCLGLSFEPRRQRILFDEPVLPAFLEQVRLHRLNVGQGTVDLALRRAGSNVLVEVLRRDGKVQVLSTS
ncbi:glycogen debranching N-terminal domain-containing protein [Pseudomonas sp. 21LCFQ010]|uniref:glycogen debranching N-terminal domain-containing protein n=1 Tax=Pseudomonas sp. 21LCFQ010 TaxID=2957506 RepID=UPI0034569738